MNNGRNHQATPLGAYLWANRRWGPFDLDPAASDWNAKAPAFYTVEDDGLRQKWFGRVWCNPPWASIGPWVDKAIAEVFETRNVELACMLLPVRGGRVWMVEKLERYARKVPIVGRLKFEAPPGESDGGGGFEDCAYYILERAPRASYLMTFGGTR